MKKGFELRTKCLELACSINTHNNGEDAVLTARLFEKYLRDDRID